MIERLSKNIALSIRKKKLTVDDVINTRKERKDEGTTYAALAQKYNVTPQCISDICNYKRWKSI